METALKNTDRTEHQAPKKLRSERLNHASHGASTRLLFALAASALMLAAPPQQATAAELVSCPGGGYGMPIHPSFGCLSGCGCAGGADDDGSYLVPPALAQQVFPTGIPFLSNYDTFYININGNITFGSCEGQFTPDPISDVSAPMIAAWYADVDFGGTDPTGASGTYLCIDEPRGRIIITWDRVGYFSQSYDKRNSFQILLTNTSDSCAAATTFDVEFRYGRLEWTTGGASGGSGGLGGTPASAGITAGNGGEFDALPGSRTAAVLNLVNNSNVDSPGVYRWVMAEGSIPKCGNGTLDTCEQCDDGNSSNNDDCTNLCKDNICGDGFALHGAEQCDQSQLSPSSELCPIGYQGTPLCRNHDSNLGDAGDCSLDAPLPIGCYDLDECGSSLLNDCDPNADCTNDVGTYACACRDGFTGDGVTCDDIDECADPALNDCTGNTVCLNVPSTFLCECAPGYSSTDGGDTCYNVDECFYRTLNDCDPNADCTDTDGGFECACAEGFDGDGRTCVDINECDDPALNNCDDDAVCLNTVGGFECVCRGNTDGDGTTCAPNCGNGVLDPGESCDPSISNTADPGYVGTCRENCSYCGDGFLSDDEECDDGNYDGDDGCDLNCTIEEGWECTGVGTEYVECFRDNSTPDTGPRPDMSTGSSSGADVDVVEAPGGKSPDDCDCNTLRGERSDSQSKWPLAIMLPLFGAFLWLRRRDDH